MINGKLNPMPVNYPEAQALIFDLDGTLVDSMPVHKVAWQEICALKGFNLSDELFYKYAGIPSTVIFQLINDEFKLDFDPDYHSHLKEELYRQKMHMVKPIDMVLDVVKYNFKNKPMAIGTGSPRSHSIEILELLKLDSYFKSIVTKDDVKNGKPAPDTFLKCAEDLQINPKDCIVFEDGDPGIEAAINAGMKVVDVRKFL